jgi:tetratricopeptide (TPR) repeat protein
VREAETGESSRQLDARLLRFRNQPDPAEGVSLAEALLQAGRSEEALEVASTGLEVRPDDVGLLVLEGRVWLARGELLRAQALLLKAARAGQNDTEPMRWLGKVLLKRGDPTRAAKILQRALKLDSSDRELRQLLERAERFARIATTAEEPSEDTRGEHTQALDDEATHVAAQAPVTAVEETAAPASSPASAPRADEDTQQTTNPRVAAPANVEEDSVTNVYEPPPTDDPWPPQKDGPTTHQRAGPTGPAPSSREPPAQHQAMLESISDEHELAEDSGEQATAVRQPPAVAPAPSSGPQPSGDVPAAPARATPEPPNAAAAPAPGAGVAPGAGDGLAEQAPPAPAAAPPGTPDAEPQPGARAGQARPGAPGNGVDGVLQVLQRQGLFEPPRTEPAEWATGKESGKVGNRVGRTLVVLWVLAMLLAAGGWYGWNRWVQHQHRQADARIAEARELARAGDHEDLVDAERLLRKARDLHPRDQEGPQLLLMVHAQRALEDGAFEPGYLRPTIARAERREADAASIAAAEAVLLASQGKLDEARKHLDRALEANKDEPFLQYIAGRLEQRLGDEDARKHLEQAVELKQSPVAASLALAEALAEAGRRDRAVELVKGVLEKHPEHLRATLWKNYLTADQAEPEPMLAKLEELAGRVDDVGAPTDRVLLELARARLQRRQGQVDAAGKAVERAVQAGATEPRLLALVASAAKAVGKLGQAQQAAMRAVGGAPSNADYRKNLARILLERRDGARALETLAPLPAEDPSVLELSARAALMVGSKKALEATAKELDAFVSEQEEPSVQTRALQLRVQANLGGGRKLVGPARKLFRQAPGDPTAAKALGEVALTAYKPDLAIRALEKATKAAPEDPEAHYLLGRAHRMAGDGEAAEKNLRKALELRPEHTGARMALGYLLLDRGKFGEAEPVYRKLSKKSGVGAGASTALIGRLGLVEALVGLGKLEDARVQLENVNEEHHEMQSYRVAAAKLALAEDEPGKAVELLRPAAQKDEAPSGIIALYGDALYEAGEVESANKQYDRVLEQDGGYPEALVGAMRVRVRAEKPRDALTYAGDTARALKQRIRPPALRAEYLTLKGRAYLQRRGSRFDDEARKALREATSIDGVPPEAWFFLGEALSGDNAPEARKAYNKYLDAEPEGPFAGRAEDAID